MRSHVVRAFGHVPEINGVFGDEVLKEVAHVERYVGVGILLDDQRTGCVLDESREKPVLDSGLGNPADGRPCERIHAFPSSGNGESGVEDHARSSYVRDPQRKRCHSTVTLFARFLGWSTSQPRRTAM